MIQKEATKHSDSFFKIYIIKVVCETGSSRVYTGFIITGITIYDSLYNGVTCNLSSTAFLLRKTLFLFDTLKTFTAAAHLCS